MSISVCAYYWCVVSHAADDKPSRFFNDGSFHCRAGQDDPGIVQTAEQLFRPKEKFTTDFTKRGCNTRRLVGFLSTWTVGRMADGG